MDKKKYLKIIFPIIVIIWIMLIIFLYKNNSVNNYVIKDWIWVDSFIKNNSSQSAFEKNTSFKIWDNLDFISFVNFGNDKKIFLDILETKKNINIENIYINDKKINESDIKSLYLSWMTIVKINWKAKTNNLEWKINYNNLIKINIIEETDNKNDEIKKVVTVSNWKLPKNITLLNNNFSSNINNLLQIKWVNLEEVDYVNIWWFSLKPQIENWTLLVSLDKDIFASWEYFIFFQLKNGKILTTENKINFIHNQNSINIANLTPKIINNTEDSFIVIQWNGFNKIISVQLNNNIILKTTSFKIINDNVAAIKIPKWLWSWIYYFNVMDTNRIYELKNNTFTIN